MRADRLARIGRGLEGRARWLLGVSREYLDKPAVGVNKVACLLLGSAFRMRALELRALRGVLLHETPPLLPAKAGPRGRKRRRPPTR